jgi:hypothetical protein
MRRLSAIFIISAIVFIAAFGVFFMLHVEGEDHVACPLGAIEGNSCEKITNPLASIQFHIKALLQPTVIPTFASILALAVFFVGALALALLPNVNALGFPLSVVFASANYSESEAVRKLRAWLVIHEKRDPSSLVAVSA